jgi:hypothetical protein
MDTTQEHQNHKESSALVNVQYYHLFSLTLLSMAGYYLFLGNWYSINVFSVLGVCLLVAGVYLLRSKPIKLGLWFGLMGGAIGLITDFNYGFNAYIVVYLLLDVCIMVIFAQNLFKEKIDWTTKTFFRIPILLVLPENGVPLSNFEDDRVKHYFNLINKVSAVLVGLYFVFQIAIIAGLLGASQFFLGTIFGGLSLFLVFPFYVIIIVIFMMGLKNEYTRALAVILYGMLIQAYLYDALVNYRFYGVLFIAYGFIGFSLGAGVNLKQLFKRTK